MAVKFPEALTVYGPSKLAVKVALRDIVPVRVIEPSLHALKEIVALNDVAVSVSSPDIVPETAQSSLNATPVAIEDEPRLLLRTLSIAIFKISFPVRGVDVSTANAEIMALPVAIASFVVCFSYC